MGAHAVITKIFQTHENLKIRNVEMNSSFFGVGRVAGATRFWRRGRGMNAKRIDLYYEEHEMGHALL